MLVSKKTLQLENFEKTIMFVYKIFQHKQVEF